MTIEYMVRCDGCGRVIAGSKSSARAARAEAQLNRGANSSAGQDWCLSCRTKRNRALDQAAIDRARSRSHSIGTQKGPTCS